MNIEQLNDKRLQAYHSAKSILDQADNENRGMTAEENERFDKFMADVDKFAAEIEKRSHLDEVKASFDSSVGRIAAPESVEERSVEITDPYLEAFGSYVRGNLTDVEMRALQIGTDSEGGYTVPQVWDDAILRALNNANAMRQIATVIQTENTRNFSVESSMSTATWIAEEGSVTTDSDPAFGQVQLGAYKLSHIIKVSNELFADSAFDMAKYCGDHLGRAFANAEESAFVAGNGTGKPTGVMNGATTAVTCSSASVIDPTEILELIYAVKPDARRNGAFLMNGSTLLALRKLRNGTTGDWGDFIWQPSYKAGQPDLLCGFPVYESDGAAEIASGASVIAFGDFSAYVIADRGSRVLRKLDQLYAASDQTGIQLTARVDGKLLDANRVQKMVMG
jgi:HK97 family phage major capsid protein